MKDKGENSQSYLENFVWIDGGSFMMGSSDNDPLFIEKEMPQHKVTVNGFYISKCEVTQRDYLNIIGMNPSVKKGDLLPVENVKWYDAIQYCNKKSVKDGLVPVYKMQGNREIEMVNIPSSSIMARLVGSAMELGSEVIWDVSANGYRLPTEAEWEYACRAGSTTSFYSGDNIRKDQANFLENNFDSNDGTMPVGSFPPNSWGLFDMHGNVDEWCWDWYKKYTNEEKINPVVNDSSSGVKVVRGGSYSHQNFRIKSAARTGYQPIYYDGTIGFRIVLNQIKNQFEGVIMTDDEKNYQAHEHFANGNSHHNCQNFVLAISEYERAIALNPVVPVYHYGLGNSYAMIRRYDLAIKEFSEAIKLNPSYIEAKRNLEVCIQSNNFNSYKSNPSGYRDTSNIPNRKISDKTYGNKNIWICGKCNESNNLNLDYCKNCGKEYWPE